jgi:hypothetical protein
MGAEVTARYSRRSRGDVRAAAACDNLGITGSTWKHI